MDRVKTVNEMFYHVEDVMTMLGYSRSHSYKIIADLNAELKAMESGTSKTQKHPFVRPAVNRTKKAAEQKMAEVLNEEIEKAMR